MNTDFKEIFSFILKVIVILTPQLFFMAYLIISFPELISLEKIDLIINNSIYVLIFTFVFFNFLFGFYHYTNCRKYKWDFFSGYYTKKSFDKIPSMDTWTGLLLITLFCWYIILCVFLYIK